MLVLPVYIEWSNKIDGMSLVGTVCVAFSGVVPLVMMISGCGWLTFSRFWKFDQGDRKSVV